MRLLILALTIVVPFPVPGASAAVDPSGTLTVAQAQTGLAFGPVEAFRNPGVATVAHPLIVWLRIPDDPAWRSSRHYLDVAANAGQATLYYRPPAGGPYRAIDFGMRVPVAQRPLHRVAPAVAIPPHAPGEPLYLRLAIDEESHVLPIVRIADSGAMASEDDAYNRLFGASLLFAGIFLSLAAANLFVFAFIHEKPYIIYTVWMGTSAVFAVTYLHDGAWMWLWPHAALPEAATVTLMGQLQSLLWLWFARSFLRGQGLSPRLDRTILWTVLGLEAVAAVFAYGFPSLHVGPALNGRDVFLFLLALVGLCILPLGIGPALHGNRAARFFALSNIAVVAAMIVAVLTNVVRHEPNASFGYIALMSGTAVQGWLLFGALAYRLRATVREFVNEQKRRMAAQADALQQSRAALEQRAIASTDPLTGIANRRAFDEALLREWDRCGRSKLPLSVIMCDVDYFKRYNDAHGHVAGDECLRRVAEAIAGCATRPTDLCARYGGEEFAVILAETDAEGAAAVGREICERVREAAIPHDGSTFGIVTVSAGGATLVPRAGEKPRITQAADEQLYRAKEAGRNRFASPHAVDLV